MIERILVAEDGSELAQAARELCFAIAPRFGASVTLVHVLDDDQAPRQAEWEERLEAVRAGAPASVEVESLVTAGRPAEALVALARERETDIVAAGTHGLGVKRLLLGSVSQRVLEAAPCSVLLARDTSPGDAPTKVLAGLDGSQLSLQALRLAEGIAVALSACLVLTHVANYHVPFAGAEPYSALREEVRRHGEAVLAAARRTIAAPVDAIIDELREGWPRDELVAACRHHRPVLAVVGGRGEGGFRELLIGSTARDLVNHAPCPVLVVKDRAASAG